jgi:uncharacterized protein YukE
VTASFVVTGDPAAITARAGVMRRHAQTFRSVALGLSSISTSGWTGRAADRFRDRFEVEPVRWQDAADGFVRAASALEGYAAALARARQAAERAAAEHARGEAVTVAARAAYDADVNRGLADKAAWEATNGPGTYTLTIEPFTDPGQAVRDGAVRAYDTAVADLDHAAHLCADGVRAGCATAPAQRNWLESGLAFVGGVLLGAGEAIWDLGQLLNRLQYGPVLDLVDLATGDLTPEELAAKKQLQVEQVQAMWTALRTDPLEFGKSIGKAVLDWDTWADDPARAIGHLVPDAIVAVATGGTATAATRGAGAARRLAGHADDLADAATDASRVARHLDQLQDLRRVDHLPDLADIPYQKGTPEWAAAVHERYPNLSEEGALGVWDYTTDNGYQTMNTALRDPGALAAHELPKAQERIAAVNRGLSELPPHPGTTYRGTDIPASMLDDYQVGRVVSDPAFLSTSESEAVAQGFRSRNGGNAFFEVHGATGRNVAPLSQYGSGEAEVLFRSGTRFEVLDKIDMGAYIKYVLREVP